MTYNTSTGVYTPPTGAENAAPGQVIRSATWNSIFTDLATALTQVGANTWVRVPRVVSGTFTVLATDFVVQVQGNTPTIFMPAASLVAGPIKIMGQAGASFAAHPATVIAASPDLINGSGTITLTTNFQVVTFNPIYNGTIYTGGYVTG